MEGDPVCVYQMVLYMMTYMVHEGRITRLPVQQVSTYLVHVSLLPHCNADTDFFSSPALLPEDTIYEELISAFPRLLQ